MTVSKMFRTLAPLLILSVKASGSVFSERTGPNTRKGARYSVPEKDFDPASSNASRRKGSRRLSESGKGKGSSSSSGKGSGSGKGSSSGSSSSTGSSSGSASSTGSSSGWRNDGYYGCLSLSSAERYEISHYHDVPDCNYVIHSGTAETSRSGNNGQNQGDNNNEPENDENSEGDEFQDEPSSEEEQDEAYGENEAADGAQENGQNSGQGSEVSSSNTNSAGQNSQVSQEHEDITAIAVSTQENPYEAFDITRCDTYEHLWTWDVILTCDEDYKNEDCTCTFANEMMNMEILSCDDFSSCPKDCPICTKCLALLQCSVASGRIGAAGRHSSGILSFTVITVLLATFLCRICKDKHKLLNTINLKANLMDLEPEEQSGNKIWMVPVDAEGDGENGVWLVPDSDSVSDCASVKSEAKRSDDAAETGTEGEFSLQELQESALYHLSHATEGAKTTLQYILMTMFPKANKKETSTKKTLEKAQTSKNTRPSSGRISFPDILAGTMKRKKTQQKQMQASNVKMMEEKKEDNNSIGKQSSNNSLFPDLLGPPNTGMKVNRAEKCLSTKHPWLPKGGVPTIPTDLTSRSFSSRESDKVKEQAPKTSPKHNNKEGEGSLDDSTLSNLDDNDEKIPEAIHSVGELSEENMSGPPSQTQQDSSTLGALLDESSGSFDGDEESSVASSLTDSFVLESK